MSLPTCSLPCVSRAASFSTRSSPRRGASCRRSGRRDSTLKARCRPPNPPPSGCAKERPQRRRSPAKWATARTPQRGWRPFLPVFRRLPQHNFQEMPGSARCRATGAFHFSTTTGQLAPATGRLVFAAGAAIAAPAGGNPAGEQPAGQPFGGSGQPAQIMAGPGEQAAAIASFAGGPFQSRAGALFLQKTQAAGRAGFKRAADAAAIAGSAFGGFFRGGAVEVDGLLLHAV